MPETKDAAQVKDAAKTPAPEVQPEPTPPPKRAAKNPTRTELALKLADAHVALEIAKQQVDINGFAIDQLIRQINNTPE